MIQKGGGLTVLFFFFLGEKNKDKVFQRDLQGSMSEEKQKKFIFVTSCLPSWTCLK